MRWEPRRAMNNQSMNALEARISRLQPWRVSKRLTCAENFKKCVRSQLQNFPEASPASPLLFVLTFSFKKEVKALF
jgi:hypothetical protein